MGKRFGTILLAVMMVLSVLSLVSPGAIRAATTSFSASDDVWMWGTTPQNGTSASMHVESGPDKKAYLKFTVSGVQNVTGATLKLTCTTGGTANIGVYAGTGNSTWTETTIAWNNRPSVGALLDSKNIAYAAGTTYAFDVSSLVTGNGTYSFIVKATSGAEVIFSTDEGTVKPVLEVSTGGAATPTPTPTPTSTPDPGSGSTLYAADDVWMWGTSPQNGTSATMYVDSSYDKKAYLKFVVSGAGSISGATLKLGCTTGGTANLGVYAGTGNNNWTETTIAWDNRPSVGTLLDSKNITFAAGTTYSFDVGSLITGDGTYSLILKSTGGAEVVFSTDEGTVRPVLELNGGGPTLPPTPTPTPTVADYPYVAGNKLYHPDGRRLIFKGTNLECGRYNDTFYHNWWTNEYNNRVSIANAIDAAGHNAVRLNAGVGSYEAQPGHYTKLEALIELYASKGIYSMPTCHDWTSGTPNINQLKTFFGKVIDNARAAGKEKWLILNPWNEGGSYSWNTWVSNCKAFIDWARTTKNFQGPIVFDTPSWAAGYDTNSYNQVISYDDQVRGSLPANILIGNHYYPWTINSCYTSADLCASYPLVVGELGRWVEEPQPNTQFALDLIDHICDYDIPNGHNGIFSWIWHWCDYGSMTDESISGSATVLNADWGQPCVQHMDMPATRGQ